MMKVRKNLELKRILLSKIEDSVLKNSLISEDSAEEDVEGGEEFGLKRRLLSLRLRSSWAGEQS